MAEPQATSDYDRGLKAGRIDSQLQQHSEHLAKINGSIADVATSNASIADSIRELASEIRTLQEEGRLAAERVKVAADVLAKETERRRLALVTAGETGDRKWSKGTWAIGVLITVALGLASLYLTFHPK